MTVLPPSASAQADGHADLLATPTSLRQATPLESARNDPDAIRLIDVYEEGGSTKFFLQSRLPLVTGRSLYVGTDEVPITLGPVLSRSGNYYYYAASLPGKTTVGRGDAVKTEKTIKPSFPKAVLDSLRVSSGFEQKSLAEITAVQGDRVMIDKGTMHEVHERDLFKIIDASGVAKGRIEIRGIGDLQSSALFNPVRAGSGVNAGDYAVFEGQRKLYGLGLIAGIRPQRSQVLNAPDHSAGGGLLWSLMFHNGWGLESVFGFYNRAGKDAVDNDAPVLLRQNQLDDRVANYILPVWVKKNFFYPSLVSPFVAAGAYWLDARHSHEVNINLFVTGRENATRRGLYPVVGAGVEFFPARFFRPRLEIRHFYAPSLTALGNTFYMSSTYYSIGVLTSW